MLDKSCVPLLKVSSQDCGMHLIVIKRNWIQFLLNLRQFSFFKAKGMGKQARPIQGVLQRFLYSFQRPSANSTVKPPNAKVSISGSHFKFQSRHSQHSRICSKLLSETLLVFVIYVILICTVFHLTLQNGDGDRGEFNFSSSYLAVLSWWSRHEAACS